MAPGQVRPSRQIGSMDRTGRIDQTGWIAQVPIVAADRQRRPRLTASSHAPARLYPCSRARPDICGIYKSGQNPLSNSYAASDYVGAGPPLDRRPDQQLASDEHAITFSLADLQGQPQGADGIFHPGKPQGTGGDHRPARRPSDRRYGRRYERTAVPFCRRRAARPQRALRCRSAPGRRMDRPAGAGLCRRWPSASVKAATARTRPAPVLIARHRRCFRPRPA